MNNTISENFTHTLFQPNFTHSSCEIAQEIMTPYFKAFIAAEVILATLAIVPNILLLSAVHDVTILPKNLRFLIGHFSIILLLFSLGTITKGLYYLIIPACDFSIHFQGCKILELATSALALPNIFYAIFSLCMERLYATLNYRNYDKDQSPYMAIFLIVVSWTTALSVNARGTFSLPTDQYAPFCDTTFVPTVSSQILFPIYMLLEWIGAATTIFIYFYNRYIAKNMMINRALYDLSARFLIDQNVQINAVIMPSMALHFICHLPTFSLLIPVFLVKNLPMSNPMRVNLTRFTFVWRLVYAFLDPLIAFRFNSHLRQHLIDGPLGKMARRAGMEWSKKKKSTVQTGSQYVAHFNYLDRMWSVGNGKVPVKAKSKVVWC